LSVVHAGFILSEPIMSFDIKEDAMKRLEILLLASLVGIGLLASGCGGGDTSSQGSPGATADANEPASTTKSKRPPRKKRTSTPPPVQGLARVHILAPETKVEGNDVVSTVRVRNASKGTITRFSVSEFWYDDAGNATPGGSRTHQEPFLPGEVIVLELRASKDSKFFQNQFEFSHANGDVEATVVAGFPESSE
jgi:hypothetical protein